MGLYTKVIDLQKLQQAWDRVKQNKPSAGVDHVTFGTFEKRKREELKQLQMELASHTYQALPVRRVTIYKDEKSRTIALYAMRDKVVQQSLAQELNRIYDPQFTSQTYAYRSDKSALTALDEIEQQVSKGAWTAALKLDIHHFFDTIQWPILEGVLRKSIYEADVIDLIRQNAVTRVLEDSGEIMELDTGIHQGSGIAPILSNIFLMEFDRWLMEQPVYFVRYSDDILILGKDEQQLKELLPAIVTRLNQLGLTLNEKKTVCRPLTEGVEFLGHAFTDKGKAIPQKAKDNLAERLELMWLTSEISLEEKVKKAVSIIGGWEQYFREERQIGTIFEFVALLTTAQTQRDKWPELAAKRKEITNIYKDITVYLADIWSSIDYKGMALFEYEQLYQLATYSEESAFPNHRLEEILAFYRKCVINESSETDTEIMQLYADARLYANASIWMERAEACTKAGGEIHTIPAEDLAKNEELIYNSATPGKILKIFAGREDIYSLESLGSGGKRQTETQLLPLTEQVIEGHLKGDITIGTYIQRPNSTVKSIIIDVDVSKKVLLQYDRTTSEFKEYMVKAGQYASEILHIYRNWGLTGYVEYSGCRGYHVWLLFTEWIPVRYANMFCELLERTLPKDEDISVEYFPNKTRIKPGKYGQCIKLPFGRHIRTGEVSCFMEESGVIAYDLNAFMDGLARYQLPAIKKILAANTGFSDNGPVTDIELDEEAFKDLPSSVEAVLQNCNLMKYLCQKASKTGYLTHFERLSLLYVFGHLGEEGKEFIHLIMSMTLNYQYQTTEKFISKIPEKPISCIKLRDQYKSITAEYGCSCSFKRSRNCYPSPVLHAISLSSDITESITVPVSRTLTKENEQKVIDEMNIHKKAEEFAGKILEMKKQRRKLDASIHKVENELSKIYDAQGIDCLEIEMGLLVRRKKENGYEWLIEI